MNYPEWWQRLLAGLIDGVILAIVFFIVNAIFGAMAGTNLSVLRIVLVLAVIVNTGLVVGYKVFFESSPMQATPGKMVFGLKVVDAGGNRAALKPVIMRTWPWWLNILSVIAVGLNITAPVLDRSQRTRDEIRAFIPAASGNHVQVAIVVQVRQVDAFVLINRQ